MLELQQVAAAERLLGTGPRAGPRPGARRREPLSCGVRAGGARVRRHRRAGEARAHRRGETLAGALPARLPRRRVQPTRPRPERACTRPTMTGRGPSSVRGVRSPRSAWRPRVARRSRPSRSSTQPTAAPSTARGRRPLLTPSTAPAGGDALATMDGGAATPLTRRLPRLRRLERATSRPRSAARAPAVPCPFRRSAFPRSPGASRRRSTRRWRARARATVPIRSAAARRSRTRGSRGPRAGAPARAATRSSARAAPSAPPARPAEPLTSIPGFNGCGVAPRDPATLWKVPGVAPFHRLNAR